MRRMMSLIASALGLFLLIALLWAAIGYRYAHDHPWEQAFRFGGIALAVGWLLVATVVSVKYVRIGVRRHRSNVAARRSEAVTRS